VDGHLERAALVARCLAVDRLRRGRAAVFVLVIAAHVHPPNSNTAAACADSFVRQAATSRPFWSTTMWGCADGSGDGSTERRCLSQGSANRQHSVMPLPGAPIILSQTQSPS